jgi:ankyrin repeat protein
MLLSIVSIFLIIISVPVGAEELLKPPFLFEAVEQGRLLEAYEASADANMRDEEGRTPIFRAIKPLAKPGMVKLLLAAKADISLVDNEGKDVLKRANELLNKRQKEGENVELLKNCIKLFKNHKEIMSDLQNNWKFYDKCLNGTPEEVSSLLERGALVNLPNSDDGLTPLTLALSNPDRRVFNMLVREGGVLSPYGSYKVIGPKDEDLTKKYMREAEEFRAKYEDEKRKKEYLKEDLTKQIHELENVMRTLKYVVASLAVFVVGLAVALVRKLLRNMRVAPQSTEPIIPTKHEENKTTVITTPSTGITQPPTVASEEPASLSEACQRANIEKAINFIKDGKSLMRAESLVLTQLFVNGRIIPSEELLLLTNAVIEYVQDQNILRKAIEYLIERGSPIMGIVGHTMLEPPIFVVVRLNNVAALGVFSKAIVEDGRYETDLSNRYEGHTLFEKLELSGLEKSDLYNFLKTRRGGTHNVL